jgi:hypothetical protein
LVVWVTAAVASGAAAVGLLSVLLGPVAWRLGGHTLAGLQGKDRADAINSVRQMLLATAGGTAALVGIGFTARTYYLARRGQLTDRYTKATAQLASDKLTERLGGVYALEHLMAESARDHNTVVELLAAFVRENAALPAVDGPPVGPGRARTAADVQAALAVLGRRPRRVEPNRLGLANTDLRGAFMGGARLRGAWLQGANLQDADLRAADLQDARLDAANLTGATLTGARLVGTALPGARLDGARLQGAIGLSVAQLQAARVGDDTGLDPLLRHELETRGHHLGVAGGTTSESGT